MVMRRTVAVLFAAFLAGGLACGPAGGGSGDGGADGGADGGTGDGGTGAPCNPVLQTGCGTGERCFLSETGDPVCEAVQDGAAKVGEACGGTTGKVCEAGAQCLRPAGAPSSTCFAFCDLASGAGCGTGETCSLKLPNNDVYGFCQGLLECDPLDGSGCDPGTGCIAAVDTRGVFFRACVPAGTAVHGESCVVQPDATTPPEAICAPGHICITVNYEMGGPKDLCLQYCAENGSEPQCPTGFVCETGEALGLTEENQPNTGLCSIPQ